MPNPTFRPKPLEAILAPQPARMHTLEFRRRPGERTPLWAIAGEAPPLSWGFPEADGTRLVELAAEVPSGDRQAPEAGSPSDAGHPRPPGIWVVERPTLGVGPAHTAIEYVPEEGKPEWISAGPERGRLVSGVGGRDYPEVRPKDRPDNMSTVGRITPPEGMTDAEQWAVLKSVDAYYKDNLDYDTWPEQMNSYNSNSYTRGLLDISGATHAIPFDDYVGGPSPVPARNFVPPHLGGTGFEGSLKPEQPSPRFRRVRPKK